MFGIASGLLKGFNVKENNMSTKENHNQMQRQKDRLFLDGIGLPWPTKPSTLISIRIRALATHDMHSLYALQQIC